MVLHLYTDGGSRNNPGPAGIGVVLKGTSGNVLEKCGKYLGIKTNNEVEYLALLEGLKIAKKYNPECLICFMDSRLVVNQLNGIFKIKNGRMRELVLQVKQIEPKFQKVEYRYIPREKNEEADFLVNQALDKKLSKT